MRAFLIIKDPKVAKLFADPNRRDILHNLRRREMTPCQLARLLGKNISSITYHLNMLEAAGLVEKTRTVVKGNLVEKFYRSTAQKFIISYTLSEGLVPGSENIAKWSKEVCKGAVENLEAFGYRIPEKSRGKLLQLIERYSSLQKIAYEEVISRQKRPVRVSRPALGLLLSLLKNIHLSQNPEYMQILREIFAELGAEHKES